MNKTLIATTALLITAIAGIVLWSLTSDSKAPEAPEPMKRWLGRP